ncbi:MAG: DUF2726 domain-containing protein [Chloroflexota bacterium]
MNDPLIIGGVIALLILVGLASAVLNNRSHTEQSSTYPYQRRDYLLSKAERSFYEVLYRAVGPDFHVFPKVRLADVVQVKRGTEKWQSHFNRINSKHVDFLLCSTDTLTPTLVIELDDSSHSSATAEAADAFRNNVFNAAGLPILRVPARSTYNSRDLADQVYASLSHV